MPKPIEQSLTVVTVTLRSGRVDTYTGVFTVPREGGLHVFTFEFFDPADWRDQYHNDAVQPVISYSLHAVESWTERDYEGPPYVIQPETDLAGRTLDPPPRPVPTLTMSQVDAAVRRGIDPRGLR